MGTYLEEPGAGEIDNEGKEGGWRLERWLAVAGWLRMKLRRLECS